MDISIPHSLGREEAKRRVEQGLPKLEQHLPGGGALRAEWPSDFALNLTISAMGQTIPVQLAIMDTTVDGSVTVPTFLKMMSGQIAEFVKTSATKMLEKPSV